MRLERFNTLSDPYVVSLLLACAAVPWWAAAIADDRPYPCRQALLDDAYAKAARWDHADVRAALAYHPRMGEALRGHDLSLALSREERAGLEDMTETQAQQLAEGNLRYEERFGHVFILQSSGRTPAEILAALDERLTHTRDAERKVAAQSMREIALLRLSTQVDEAD